MKAWRTMLNHYRFLGIAKAGIPYQTLIKSVLYQFATDQL